MAMARVDGLQYESKQQRLAGVLLEPLAFVYAPLSTRDRLRVAAAAANAAPSKRRYARKEALSHAEKGTAF